MDPKISAGKLWKFHSHPNVGIYSGRPRPQAISNAVDHPGPYVLLVGYHGEPKVSLFHNIRII